MTDHSITPGPTDEPTRIDISTAHPARVYDYILGGKDHFSVDREAVEDVATIYPGGIDDVRAFVREFRAFLGRTLRFLAADAGIDQFLEIGSGIQNRTRPHEVAQGLVPTTRMVYIDPDPVALAHAHSLRSSTPEGAVAHVQCDVGDVERILRESAATLDFARPVAVRQYSLLNRMSDDEAYDVVARLMEAVPPGSYLVVSTSAGDVGDRGADAAAERFTSLTRDHWVTRTYPEVCRFFDGLELVEPGVVTVERWRPTGPPLTDLPIPFYGAVARKV